jgi:hypothetical protein
MKRVSFLTAGFLITSVLILSSFTHLSFSTGKVAGSDALTAEITGDIPVDEFSSLAVSIDAEIYVEQSNEFKLEIETSQETLDKIEVKVQNGKLIIKPESYNTRIREDVVIYVSAPDYESISLAGSGKLFAEKKMDLEEITLKIAGSGDMQFDELGAGEVEIKISGSGNVALKGRGSEELEIAIAGSGNLDTTEFEVSEMAAKISGSGDCKVWVKDEITAAIAGSGSIYYKGRPSIDSSVAGSGKVKSL